MPKRRPGMQIAFVLLALDSGEGGRLRDAGRDRRAASARGLYSSHLSSWRRAAREGSLRGLAKKRGPKPSGGKREARKVRKLERENARLREEFRKVRIIIDVQGGVAGLLGLGRRPVIHVHWEDAWRYAD